MKSLENPLALATFTDRTVNGRVRGQQIRFADKSAKELKAELKAGGMKPKDIKIQVNRVLRGETDMRNAVGMAVMQSLISRGLTFDVANTTKDSATATIKMVKVDRPNVETSDVLALSADKKAQMLAALLAEQEAEKAAKVLEAESSVEVQADVVPAPK